MFPNILSCRISEFSAITSVVRVGPCMLLCLLSNNQSTTSMSYQRALRAIEHPSSCSVARFLDIESALIIASSCHYLPSILPMYHFLVYTQLSSIDFLPFRKKSEHDVHCFINNLLSSFLSHKKFQNSYTCRTFHRRITRVHPFPKLF